MEISINWMSCKLHLTHSTYKTCICIEAKYLEIITGFLKIIFHKQEQNIEAFLHIRYSVHHPLI